MEVFIGESTYPQWPAVKIWNKTGAESMKIPDLILSQGSDHESSFHNGMCLTSVAAGCVKCCFVNCHASPNLTSASITLVDLGEWVLCVYSASKVARQSTHIHTHTHFLPYEVGFGWHANHSITSPLWKKSVLLLLADASLVLLSCLDGNSQTSSLHYTICACNCSFFTSTGCIVTLP